MGAVYRGAVQVSVWLGIIAFLVGIVLVLTQPNAKFLFLLPRGWLNGAQTFFLAGIALYCLIRARS